MSADNFYYKPDSFPMNTQQSVNPPIIANTNKKTEIKLTKRDLIFTLVFALLSFMLVDFTLFHGLNLGFTVSYYAIFIATTAYLFDNSRKPSVFSCICGALSVAGALTFTIYHDKFINLVMLIIICFLFSIYTCGLSGTFSHSEGSYRITGDIASGILVKPFSHSSDITASFGKSFKKGTTFKNVLIGIGISLPVLLVVIPLLIRSDEAFGGLVELVIIKSGMYLLELLLAIIVAVYLALYFVSKKKRLGMSESKKPQYKGFAPKAVSISFLSVISLVYVTYLFSQLAYFFSAFEGILPEGYAMTASEFARRGFFEMFAVCAINIVIITGVTILTKKGQGKMTAVKCISAFIMAFTVLLLITAAAKMKLNIEIFGLSKNRIMVSVFMVMMLVAVIFYVIHIFKPKFNYMQSIVVICSAIFIALAFCNVDARIAEYNILAFKQGNISFDVEYLADLSDSTAEYLVDLAKSDNKIVKDKALQAVYNDIVYDSPSDFVEEFSDGKIAFKLSKDIREYNYSRNKAQQIYLDFCSSLNDEQRMELTNIEYEE